MCAPVPNGHPTPRKSSHRGSLGQVDTHTGFFLLLPSQRELSGWCSPTPTPPPLIQNEKAEFRGALCPCLLGSWAAMCPLELERLCASFKVVGDRKETGGHVGPSWRPPMQAGFYCVAFIFTSTSLGGGGPDLTPSGHFGEL